MENIRDKFLSFIQRYCIIFTGSTLSMLAYLSIYKEPFVSIDSLLVLMFISAIISFFQQLLFSSEENYSKKAVLIRSFLHFLIIMTSVLLSAILFNWVETTQQFWVLTLIIIGTYSILWLVFYFKDHLTSQKINQNLNLYKERMKKHDESN
ncbi:MAG: DUF3021 family protein [Carnobacterium sp.]